MAGGIAVDAVRKHRPNGDHATGDDEYNIPDITFYQPGKANSTHRCHDLIARD
jgi:hypothetical protein